MKARSGNKILRALRLVADIAVPRFIREDVALAYRDGTAVVLHDGRIEAAAPVIHGWVACWKRIEARRKIGADLEALSAIAHHLDAGHPTPHDPRARRMRNERIQTYQ